jgi:hypothetical protein
MRITIRVLILLGVLFGVGWLAAVAVMHHAVAGTPVAEVRLAAAMAGLFAGGAAVVVVGLVIVLRR